MRRYLIIAAVAVLAIGLLVAGYFFFFSSNASVTVTPPSGTPPIASSTLPNSTYLNNGSPGQEAPATSTPTATQVAPRLVEIDKGPVVAGIVAFDTTVATTTPGGSSTPDVQINYLERESGNIFSYDFDSRLLTRISNRTIPGIQEAYWTSTGSTTFIRYLSGTNNSTINTYALPAYSSGGFFLPQDIDEIAVGASSVLTLASGNNGTIANTEHADGTGLAQVFTTPLSSLRATFAGKGTYLAFTKPSSTLAGYAFLVNGSGNFVKVAGPLNGLVALPNPAGTEALVSYSDAGVMKMELVDLTTGAATALPVATIADKCTWTADGADVYCAIPIDPSTSYAYPDDWYQGAVSFSDRIWEINTAGRYAQLVLDFNSQTGETLDATNLAIDPNQIVLAFRNKVDGSLWAYQL